MLEELLTFHAWYKLGDPPITEDTTEEEINHLQESIRKLLAKVKHFCPRVDGYGWKIQKFHELLHLVYFLYYFRHSENFDAGVGERLLKDFFKQPAATAQQRGGGVFVEQVADRLQVMMLLSKATRNPKCSTEVTAQPQPSAEHQLMGSSFRLDYDVVAKGVTPVWLGKKDTTQIHPVLLSYFAKEWRNIVGDSDSVVCKTEFKNGNGIDTYRSHPDYNSEGPWYDWAMVKFETTRGELSFPSRLLCFFESPGTSTLKAVVHPATYRDNGRAADIRSRRSRLLETRLCSRWPLDHRQRTGGGGAPRCNVPSLFCVEVETLEENLLVVEEEPGLVETFGGTKFVWEVKDRRSFWPEMFP